MNSYWAYQWLDFHGVTTVKGALTSLTDKVALNHLHELAVSQSARPQDGRVDLVAGRGIDLSGHLDCNGPACRMRQVDNLLRHAWHYFDRVLVADALSHEVSYHWNPRSAELKTWLAGHLEVLLYLRSIGAEDLLVFAEKPPPCQTHLARHAVEAGLPGDLDSDEALLKELAAGADLHLRRARGRVRYAFTHPQFEHTVWGELIVKKGASSLDAQLRNAVVRDVVQLHLSHLSSDVSMAHRALAPLGSVLWLHGRFLSRSARRITPAEVIFHLDLPVLNDVPIDTLIKIRKDDGDAFERFRDSLKRAVTEQLRDNTSDSGRVADTIRQDIIEPELVRIRQRLATAERVLNQKALVGVTMASLLTTCGLLAGIAAPLAVTGGIGTLATIAANASLKHLDEQREVSLSDMYFLWKALQHT